MWVYNTVTDSIGTIQYSIAAMDGKFFSIMILILCLWFPARALPLSHQKMRAITYGICDIPLDMLRKVQLEER